MSSVEPLNTFPVPSKQSTNRLGGRSAPVEDWLLKSGIVVSRTSTLVFQWCLSSQRSAVLATRGISISGRARPFMSLSSMAQITLSREGATQIVLAMLHSSNNLFQLRAGDILWSTIALIAVRGGARPMEQQAHMLCSVDNVHTLPHWIVWDQSRCR